MPKIKKIVVRYLIRVTLVMVIVILLTASLIQTLNTQHRARETASAMFIQIEQILAENQNELKELKAEYTDTCLHNAEAISFLVERDLTLLDDLSKLREIAVLMEVDEIHFFDKTGRIFTGTHPEYYDLTMASGEQIGFFSPMLQDRSLKMVQDITPNTAEAKMMQYSALWSSNGEFIVQVGMEPKNVVKVTEKNELSYIFSLLRVNTGVSLYAFDKNTGKIMGATALEDVGKYSSDIGLDLNKVYRKPQGFHAKINGSDNYCVFMHFGDNIIGRFVSNDTLYKDIPLSTIGLAAGLILISAILVFSVTWYMNRYVIKGIAHTNEKLRAISAGDLTETVDVQTSLEFSELSNHINVMIKSLLAGTDKMSYVLNKTNLPVGVYEYNGKMKKVLFTDYVPKILMLDNEKAAQLASDYKLFREHLNNIRSNPVQGEDGVYRLDADIEHYVKLDELSEENETLGIIIDVTEETAKRLQIEAERDIDLLTGLYNRRGLENRLEELFSDPVQLDCGAMIMVDADGLKEINDKYGHDKGDIYLKKIAEMLGTIGSRNSVTSREGGDEFVLFLYGYSDEKELLDDLDTLKYTQCNSTAQLGEDISVPLNFSYGYSLTEGHSDYRSLMKEADERMYENKRERKKLLKHT